MKLNPHVHAVFFDGVYRDKSEDGDEPQFRALPHLATRDVAAVLERTRDRMTKYLRRRGLLDDGGDDAEEADASERAGLPRLAALKKAFSDGTVAVDLDPLSLLSRLCASVPPPRFHTVR